MDLLRCTKNENDVETLGLSGDSHDFIHNATVLLGFRSNNETFYGSADLSRYDM